MSRKSRKENTLCQSKFTRSNYYKATSLLRFFAFWELEDEVTKLNSTKSHYCCSPEYYFNVSCAGQGDRGKLTNLGSNQISFEWLEKLIQTKWKAYAYVGRFHSLHDILSKLVLKVIDASYFNDDWTLTEHALDFRNRLRKRWEHKLKIYAKEFYYCSSQQLYFLIKNSLEDMLETRSKTFIDQINAAVTQLFNYISFDSASVNGKELKQGFKIRDFPQDLAITMLLKGGILGREFEKKATKFVEAFFKEPSENLVSSEYLDRLAGSIQAENPKDDC